MKTLLQYLEEQKEKAWHNRFCSSKTYSMDTPREGQEQAFAEAARDCEIVDELIALVQAKETPAEQTPPCDCPFKKDGAQLMQFIKEIEDYASTAFPTNASQSPEQLKDSLERMLREPPHISIKIDN